MDETSEVIFTIVVLSSILKWMRHIEDRFFTLLYSNTRGREIPQKEFGYSMMGYNLIWKVGRIFLGSLVASEWVLFIFFSILFFIII